MKNYKTLFTAIIASIMLVGCKDDCEKYQTGELVVINDKDNCIGDYAIYLDGKLEGTIQADDTFSLSSIAYGPHALKIMYGSDAVDTSVQIYTCNTTTYIHAVFCGSSDKRYKRNISPLLFNMNEFMQLNAYSYDYKNDEFSFLPKGKHNGFIAQDMLEIYPQLVKENKEGYYSINYMEMIPILTKALQEQQKQIESLQQEVSALKASPANL